MKRREFMALLGGSAVAWPLVVRAQQPERMRRIGVLNPNPEGDPTSQARVTALLQSLAKLGWTVGRNIRIDYRWGAPDAERVRADAAELLALAPDVILANTSRAVATLQLATRTVPVVFTGIAEPVAQGFVPSLAHPGGNMTGFTNVEATVGAKWLALLKEVAPRVTRVAYMFNPDNPGPEQYVGSAAAAGPKLAMEVVMAPVHGPAEIEAAITLLGREPGGGLIVPPDGFTNVYRKLIIDLAARYRLPAISGNRAFADDGGLAYYGVDSTDQFRQAAAYVDRILRGEKPGDLPVQQPTKFDLVINLTTAKALGLDISPALLSVADELIE
jgi:putative tryptophan/tyrosine transport system substrate-binding protein